jgi:hypothetical protein
MRHIEPGIIVTISKEGLRRAANDNAALVKSSKLHEVVTYCAAMFGVVFFVAWTVDSIARAWA